ncbi:MAG: gamma-glutamylcyclotransferase [Pseudomonadota bacterium]
MDAPLWVFGYGSLIWNPEFPFVRKEIARLDGYRRAFCMASIHHRGSEDAPGLVLALDAQAGASCEGVAFEIAPAEAAEALAGLRERELISSAYVEREIDLAFRAGGGVQALAYVIEKDHRQYRGDLTLETQAEIIARATGGRGPNRDYLFNTAAHLEELGIADPDLAWLRRRVGEIVAEPQ